MTHHSSAPTLAEFAALADAFCGVVIDRDQQAPEAQLDAIHKLLPQLYAAALRLPAPSAQLARDIGVEGSFRALGLEKRSVADGRRLSLKVVGSRAP